MGGRGLREAARAIYAFAAPSRAFHTIHYGCCVARRAATSAVDPITATPESYRGSSFATRADADKACEAADAGATVLRASSISGRFKLAGGREYWVHDEMRAGNNCWRN